MLAVGIILLSVFCGWQVVRLFPWEMHRLECLAMCVAIGFNLVSWIVFCFAALFGFTIGLPAALIAVMVACSLSQTYAQPRLGITSDYYHKNIRAIFICITLVTVLVLSVLIILSYQFPASNGSWLTIGYGADDNTLHVALIRQFSIGDKIDLVSPVFRRVPLTYPFIGDFYSALLLRAGASMPLALTVPTLMLGVSLLQLIFSFGYMVLRSARGAWLQFLMLVYSGPLKVGLSLLWIASTKGLSVFNTLNIALQFDRSGYLNFLFSHPLPQHSFMFGMPLTIVLLMCHYRLYESRNSSKVTHFPVYIIGIIAGLLPLIHTHSFLVLVGTLTLATALMAWRKSIPRGWMKMVIMFLLVSCPQIFWQFHSSYSSHFNRFILGWMFNSAARHSLLNWAIYWFMNLGALFVIILVGWYILRRMKAPIHLEFIYYCGTLIFAICNVAVFQPNIWDNMKIMEYGFWFIMLAAAYIFERWLIRPEGKFMVAILMLSLTTAGFFTLIILGPFTNREMLTKADANFGTAMARQLPKNAYIITSSHGNQPVLMLANRKLLIASNGWYNLYRDGWQVVYNDNRLMLTGDSAAPALIDKYSVNYAVFSQKDVIAGRANLGFYKKNYRLFADQDGWWVFDISHVASDIVDNPT